MSSTRIDRRSVKIAPSILASDFSRLADQLADAERGGADWIHLDVMDGHFVPNLTFGPPVIEMIRQHSRLPFDTHLMVEAPERLLSDFRRAGADLITVHQEACRHLHRTLARIRELGARAGVALNPATPVDLIQDVIADVDLVLIMSVNPGFGGQKFIPHSIERIRQARELIERTGKEIHLEVDGGIDCETAPQVVEAGADVLVAGTSIFRRGDVREAIAALRNSVTVRRERDTGR